MAYERDELGGKIIIPMKRAYFYLEPVDLELLDVIVKVTRSQGRSQAIRRLIRSVGQRLETGEWGDRDSISQYLEES